MVQNGGGAPVVAAEVQGKGMSLREDRMVHPKYGAVMVRTFTNRDGVALTTVACVTCGRERLRGSWGSTTEDGGQRNHKEMSRMVQAGWFDPAITPCNVCTQTDTPSGV